MPTSKTGREGGFGTIPNRVPNNSEHAETTQKLSIGFKADPIADQDILAWWAGLTAGKRSEALRQIIRESIQGKTETSRYSDAARLGEISEEVILLRLTLADLPRRIEAMLGKVVVQPTSNSVPEEENVLDQETAEHRRENLNRANW